MQYHGPPVVQNLLHDMKPFKQEQESQLCQIVSTGTKIASLLNIVDQPLTCKWQFNPTRVNSAALSPLTTESSALRIALDPFIKLAHIGSHFETLAWHRRKWLDINHWLENSVEHGKAFGSIGSLPVQSLPNMPTLLSVTYPERHLGHCYGAKEGVGQPVLHRKQNGS